MKKPDTRIWTLLHVVVLYGVWLSSGFSAEETERGVAALRSIQLGDIRMKEVPLTEAIMMIQTKLVYAYQGQAGDVAADVIVKMDPERIKRTMISAEMAAPTLEEAYAAVARQAGCRLSFGPEGILLVSKKIRVEQDAAPNP